MVREELLASAINFLQDPSVSTSPIEKKIAFLQSKNLTKEEIDLALARLPGQSYTGLGNGRAHEYGSSSSISPTSHAYEQHYTGSWLQPQRPAQRDWRDWFIMATVTSGVGYALYSVAQRYIVPIIAPPTPSQLEQDKAAIDESFDKAFALIDQLAKDTEAIKLAEVERTEKLDTTIRDVDNVINDLREANTRRERENRLLADQIYELKNLVPRALETWKSGNDTRLGELSTEMQSLKKLLENRVGRTAGTLPPIGRALQAPSTTSAGDSIHREDTSRSSIKASTGPTDPTATNTDTDTIKSASNPKVDTLSQVQKKSGIPAWQLAAAQTQEDSSDSAV